MSDGINNKNECNQWHGQQSFQYPTSCCPAGAHPLSTRKLWLWVKRVGDTPTPPRHLSGPLWTSSRAAGWSQVARLREKTHGWGHLSCFVEGQQLCISQKVKCITSNYGNYISASNWLIVWNNYVNEKSKAMAQWGACSAFFYLFTLHIGSIFMPLPTQCSIPLPRL